MPSKLFFFFLELRGGDFLLEVNFPLSDEKVERHLVIQSILHSELFLTSVPLELTVQGLGCMGYI